MCGALRILGKGSASSVRHGARTMTLYHCEAAVLHDRTTAMETVLLPELWTINQVPGEQHEGCERFIYFHHFRAAVSRSGEAVRPSRAEVLMTKGCMLRDAKNFHIKWQHASMSGSLVFPNHHGYLPAAPHGPVKSQRHRKA